MRSAVGITLAMTLVGCSMQAEQLKQHPLMVDRSVETAAQGEKSIVIYPFDDHRGGEFGSLYPTTVIPVVGLFHFGWDNQFPEQSRKLITKRGSAPTVSVGSLDSAMPFLFSSVMRDMRLTPSATPLDAVSTQVDLGEYDYVVQGSVTRTKMTDQGNVVPLGALSVFGVPFIFVDFELEYEVRVFRPGDLSTPILEKTYVYEDDRAVGLYYNQDAAYELFVDALEETVPQAVEDIAAAMVSG